MAFQPVPVTMQCELRWLWNGQRVENVLHFTAQDAYDFADDAPSIGALIMTAYNSTFRAQIVDDCSLQSIYFTDLTDENGPVLDYTTGLPSAGTNSGDSLPNNVAMVIKKHTGGRGRSFRGRVYAVGHGEGQWNGLEFNSATRSAWLDFLGAMLTFTVNTHTYDMSIVQRYSDGVFLAAGVPHSISHFSTNGLANSQRRRLPGRGQ